MASTDVVCPRCGQHLGYREVYLSVDVHDLDRPIENGPIEQTDNYWTDYLDIPDEVTSITYGSVRCYGKWMKGWVPNGADNGHGWTGCGAEWPSIEALEQEIRRKQIEANLPPFGELAITHY